MDAMLHALNRFGLGARGGDGGPIGDARGWLISQLDGGAPVQPPPPGATPAEIATVLRDFRTSGKTGSKERAQQRRRLIELAASEGRAALEARVVSQRPYVERLVAFWSNHLCVSAAAKGLVAPLAGSYEREAIRPHVLGRFEDMVLASATHPAMLFYLDNFRSMGPRSPGAKRRPAGDGAPRGLNENYARELLELHTLGVDGGYTQADVQQLARILTGWSVGGIGQGRARTAGESGPIRFAFDDRLHEPGAKSLLGKRYAEAGVEEGRQAIRDLCRNPATAQFVASKLVTHFVADEPPPRAVGRIAATFQHSGGDLRAVAAELVRLPEAWAGDTPKFRTPQDWVVAMLRACDIRQVVDATFTVLRRLRHPLWSPPSPKGFGDRFADWSDPDSLLNRAELARSVARRTRGLAVDPRAVAATIDATDDAALGRLLADASIAPDERIALVLAGPAFQWR